MFLVEMLLFCCFSTAPDQALFYLLSFRSAVYLFDQHFQLLIQLLYLFTFIFILYLIISFIMQLGDSVDIPEVNAHLNQGGINYVELIKSELTTLLDPTLLPSTTTTPRSC